MRRILRVENCEKVGRESTVRRYQRLLQKTGFSLFGEKYPTLINCFGEYKAYIWKVDFWPRVIERILALNDKSIPTNHAKLNFYHLI